MFNLLAVFTLINQLVNHGVVSQRTGVSVTVKSQTCLISIIRGREVDGVVFGLVILGLLFGKTCIQNVRVVSIGHGLF